MSGLGQTGSKEEGGTKVGMADSLFFLWDSVFHLSDIISLSVPSCNPAGGVILPGVSNLQPAGLIQPRMAANVAQYRIINLLKT